jgi:type I restriction enzyme R subunit
MTAVLKDDVELFKQFSDNESFRRWLTDTIFALAYGTEKKRNGGEGK